MEDKPRQGNREVVVNPGEFAYLQETTKGSIKTHTGPIVVNQTGQDQPVVFDKGRFQTVNTLEGAVRQSPRAGEGDYIVLENPAVNEAHPEEAGVGNLPGLRHGCKVNIPGPTIFALWPGQEAQVIKGHHLRSNQYLLVRVYNEEESKKNWGKAVMKMASPVDDGKDDGKGKDDDKDAKDEKKSKKKDEAAAFNTDELTIGTRLIIPGTEVSFYIPPTGVEVVPDEMGNYVRDAVTLERLEVAILVDEDGNKRYERGPQVVFPKPTEEFFTNETSRKFKAIELNNIQGIHVKVIAPYEELGKKYSEGDEIFITGRNSAIYYQRPEHSIIQYGDKLKHYATAVPVGEGRYVMNRDTGEIKTEGGPQMLLPNPVSHVIVRRVLSDKEVTLWYPDNAEALQYNRNLRSMTGAGDAFVSEQSYSSNLASRGMVADAGSFEGMAVEEKIPGGIHRKVKHTKPRTVTLDTKYDGVPVVRPYTGYAIMVVSKTGRRDVVVGPDTVLLGYDESLEVLTVSTGKPKTMDNPKQIVYLRVKNNKVSDRIKVNTSDHVEVDVQISLRVDFEGDDKERWFEVENYVKFLTDHIRSVLKGTIRFDAGWIQRGSVGPVQP